jgi:hypothetical protein
VGVLLVLLAQAGYGSADVRGTSAEFKSPTGTRERCVILERMPGGTYTAADSEQERTICAIDFHDGTHALCPKVFSTSPGTLVYALAGSRYEGEAADFERDACAAGGVNKGAASGEPLAYKMSVNTRETSATFANAALLYYHFARYFQATAHVPVAVLRTIDRAEHERRVSARGVGLSADRANLRMNHAGWLALQRASREPSSYQPQGELLTSDGQLYGVLLHIKGRRFSEEINGTRHSGWGEGQSRDFQETAPFRALRSSQPLAAAIVEGRAAAFRDPTLARATGKDATPEQMVFWMSDLVDITLLDYIFSQQDRIGNVDYLPYWYWRDGQTVQRRPAEGRELPPDLAGRNPVYLKRTELGDNDAGARITYANFTRRTGMLESLRHYRANAYQQLMRLDRDFQSGGQIHRHVGSVFGLNEREFAQVRRNTAEAAAILRASCQAGRLRLDVEPEEFFLTGTVVPRNIPCEG